MDDMMSEEKPGYVMKAENVEWVRPNEKTFTIPPPPMPQTPTKGERMRVEFAKLTDQDHARLSDILDRASQMFPDLDRLSLMMDMKACHTHCPLDFARLLTADDVTFGHDIGGIMRHMDRETGHLGGCFVPRTAA